MSDINPYAAPADVATVAGVDCGVTFFRDGRFLVVRDGAELPETCVVTNEPADRGSWRKRVRITWTPSWVYVLILVNLIVLLIVALILESAVGKRMWGLQLGSCDG